VELDRTVLWGDSEKVLKVFEWEDIYLDAAIEGTVPNLRTERSGVVELGLSPAVYAHVSTRNIGMIRSPLDNLDLKKGN
jgi:hypothetical protein